MREDRDMRLQKLFITASLFALTQLPTEASAQWRYRRHGYYRPYHRRPHYRRHHRDDVVIVGTTSCSPEMKQKNVALLEATLNDVAKSENFANAQQFQETLQQIQKEQNIDKRIQEYCNLVGVDSSKNDEFVEFLGSRDHSAYIERAQKNLGLSSEQADQLVVALRSTLISGLNGP
jgi:hypothetical protein